MDPSPLVPILLPDTSRAVRIGIVRATPVEVAPAGRDLEDAMDDLARSLAARHAGKAPGEIPGLEPARELYHAFGIDPTRTRPSSEALLRRVLKGLPLPRILSAVDVSNLCSLRFLLPIGLYDVARIEGGITLRRGAAGESYPGIRKDAVHLDGRPVLVDATGPFGNPTSDSLRTCVSASTRDLLMVIFAPASYSRDRLSEHVEVARETMGRFLAAPGEAVHAVGAVVP